MYIHPLTLCLCFFRWDSLKGTQVKFNVLKTIYLAGLPAESRAELWLRTCGWAPAGVAQSPLINPLITPPSDNFLGLWLRTCGVNWAATGAIVQPSRIII